MQNKSKSWADIQMIISSIAVAVTMGFWSLFSSNQKLTAGATGTANLPGQPDPNAATANNDVLLPGQVMLLNGSSAPSGSTQASASAPAASSSNRRNNGGGGGGSSSGGGGSSVAPAPKPAPKPSGGGGTGSSKP